MLRPWRPHARTVIVSCASRPWTQTGKPSVPWWLSRHAMCTGCTWAVWPSSALKRPAHRICFAPSAGTAGVLSVANIEEGVRRGFVQLDELDLRSELRRRVLTLQGVPHKVRGSLRCALRTGLRAALESADQADACRGWKLFFLAPRMLLYRSAGQALGDAAELEQRCVHFQQGEWLHLLREATGMRPEQGRGLPAAGDQAKAAKATRLVQLGELSAAARALTAEPLAPGTAETLAELRDPERRPPDIQVPLSPELLSHQPATAAPCRVCVARLLAGSAPGVCCGPLRSHQRALAFASR